MSFFVYHHLPALMALLGAGCSMSLYALYEYVFQYYPGLQIPVCSLLTLLFTVASFFGGNLLKKLRLGTYTDPLTNLWNQRYFYTKLNEELRRTKRVGSPLCLAIIDVDNFKQVNDIYGHLTGDKVLKKLAELFIQQTRSIDSVIRLGGDEFAILFPETGIEQALMAAERIRKIAAQSDRVHQVTLSIGIIPVEPGCDTADLLRSVDKTLYKAKAVKNKVSTA